MHILSLLQTNSHHLLLIEFERMADLCAVRLIHTHLPIHAAPPHPHPRISSLFPCRTRYPFVLKHSRYASGLIYCVNSPLSSTTSGETVTTTTDKLETDGLATPADVDEKKEDSNTQLSETDKVDSDGGIATADYAPPEEKKEDSGAEVNEADKPQTDSVVSLENASVDEKKDESLPDLQLSKFLEDLGIEFDYEKNKYSLLTIGGGGLVAVWVASIVVGAIDSIPLLPKLLELVGLGYSIWFAIRYLIFEESRGELVAKIEQVKQEIFG
ncbi:uncharacterized protein LOC127248399 [Andrographis paniculata]|uniref:uncharacterized protein LOC127248399 n=1 Tax=Andrographis paniculata TaxID=175694 RepID=UPI0021E7DFEB|nr:uncharacterized protein LOC127248399 [Andrographis paniculata]